jgi:hypothetical protein
MVLSASQVFYLQPRDIVPMYDRLTYALSRALVSVRHSPATGYVTPKQEHKQAPRRHLQYPQYEWCTDVLICDQ